MFLGPTGPTVQAMVLGRLLHPGDCTNNRLKTPQSFCEIGPLLVQKIRLEEKASSLVHIRDLWRCSEAAGCNIFTLSLCLAQAHCTL